MIELPCYPGTDRVVTPGDPIKMTGVDYKSRVYAVRLGDGWVSVEDEYGKTWDLSRVRYVAPTYVMVPLSIDALALWLAADITKHDNYRRPKGGLWTIEPELDGVVSHIATLIEGAADGRRYEPDDEKPDVRQRMVNLLTEIAGGQS